MGQFVRFFSASIVWSTLTQAKPQIHKSRASLDNPRFSLSNKQGTQQPSSTTATTTTTTITTTTTTTTFAILTKMVNSPAHSASPTSPVRSDDTCATLVAAHRFKIYFQDDAVCRRSQANAQQLLSLAMDTSMASENTRLLAKKALQYRKVYERMAGVDVTTSDFDVSAFLGVAWCKTPCLKAHCESRQ